jgi:hypothetical protein
MRRIKSAFLFAAAGLACAASPAIFELLRMDALTKTRLSIHRASPPASLGAGLYPLARTGPCGPGLTVTIPDANSRQQPKSAVAASPLPVVIPCAAFAALGPHERASPWLRHQLARPQADSRTAGQGALPLARILRAPARAHPGDRPAGAGRIPKISLS